METPLFWIVPGAAVLALALAWYFYREMKKENEGTPTMRKIALHVRQGAMSYLRQQYKVVGIVFACLVVVFAIMAFGFDLQNHWVPVAFLTGGFFSGLAGFIGMKTATYASARTAHAASRSLNRGLRIAFRSGAVMGLIVVGLGLLDISLWFLILDHFIEAESSTAKLTIITTTMLTFGMGASTQALFAASEAESTPKPPTWVPTLSEKWKPAYRKTTRAIRPRLPTTWATMWATWPAWVPTSTSRIAAPFSPLRLWEQRHL